MDRYQGQKSVTQFLTVLSVLVGSKLAWWITEYLNHKAVSLQPVKYFHAN